MKPRDPEDLESIPRVGKSIVEDLRNIGIARVSDLYGKNPEALFDQSNAYERRI